MINSKQLIPGYVWIVLCFVFTAFVHLMIFCRSTLLPRVLSQPLLLAAFSYTSPKGEACLDVAPLLVGSSPSFVAGTETESPFLSVSYHHSSQYLTLLTREASRSPSDPQHAHLKPLLYIRLCILPLALQKQSALLWRGPNGRGWQGFRG